MKLRNFKKIIAVSVLFASSNVFSADTPLTTDELGNLMAVYINKATDVMVALRDNKADKADIAAYTKDMDEALNAINSNFENIGRELGTKVDYNSFNQFIEYVNSANKELTDSINKGFNTINAVLETEVDKLRMNLLRSNPANIATARNNVLIQNIDDKVNKLDKKVRKGLAAQAALTGLFQPYNIGKANITAAVGGYKSNTAIAIGTGYRFNEHVAAKAGIALSTGSGKAVSYNAGVNYEW